MIKTLSTVKKIQPFTPVWNETGALWTNIKHGESRSYHSFCLQAQNRYESELSNEVLYILVGQEAAKMFEVKVGGQTENCTFGQLKPNVPGASWTGRFFINLQLWPLIFLQPLDLQGRTVPCLKDLNNICLENGSQGLAMTFNMIYLCLKYPYFISYRGLC